MFPRKKETHSAILNWKKNTSFSNHFFFKELRVLHLATLAMDCVSC